MSNDGLQAALATVLAPLIEADGGELYLVPTTSRVVHLHLRGRFSGCPGNLLVTDHVLRPVIQVVQPTAQLQITSGALLPDRAERIHSAPSSSGGVTSGGPGSELAPDSPAPDGPTPDSAAPDIAAPDGAAPPA